jgi:hypothetical protein
VKFWASYKATNPSSIILRHEDLCTYTGEQSITAEVEQIITEAETFVDGLAVMQALRFGDSPYEF